MLYPICQWSQGITWSKIKIIPENSTWVSTAVDHYTADLIYTCIQKIDIGYFSWKHVLGGKNDENLILFFRY